MTDGAGAAPMVFECVPSRCGPWPEVLIFLTTMPIPAEEHFAEVLDLNPALKGWGEPLP